MKKNILLTLSLLLVGVAPHWAQTTQTGPIKPALETADTALPKFEVDEYQFGILRRGPKSEAVTAENKEAIDKLQAGHMANIQKMAADGKLMAAGPMGDAGSIRGIFLFKVGSVAEAQAAAAVDPMIKAEYLQLDLHVWQGPKGIGEKFIAEYKTNPATKATMTKYFLVLLTRGTAGTELASNEMLRLQREHLWHIRRMLDAKTFVGAGPFNVAAKDKNAMLGIFVIAAATMEEAQAVAQRDPLVKAGQLAIEIHPWWVAKEVWP